MNLSRLQHTQVQQLDGVSHSQVKSMTESGLQPSTFAEVAVGLFNNTYVKKLTEMKQRKTQPS